MHPACIAVPASGLQVPAQTRAVLLDSLQSSWDSSIKEQLSTWEQAR